MFYYIKTTIFATSKKFVMKVQEVQIDDVNMIPSGFQRECISVRRFGIAKVLWRDLRIIVPASKVIAGGVDI